MVNRGYKNLGKTLIVEKYATKGVQIHIRLLGYPH